MAPQTALDTARMDIGAEMFPDKPRQFGRPKRRFFLDLLPNEGHDLVGELVRVPGAARAGHQADEAGLLESRQRLIKGRPRKTETGRRLRQRLAVGLDAAQHLVLDLDQVAGIEEFVLEKQLVADLLGAWVEASLLLERLELGIGFGHRHLAKRGRNT